MSHLLTEENAYIFRIVHIDNIETILKNGICCRNSTIYGNDYVEIGNPDLIGKRASREIPVLPGGTLSDYVPFYFTPYSPMLLNIKTGYNVKQRPMEEIVILVASLRKLAADNVNFVFTDRHAFLSTAQFTNDLSNLTWLPWELFQAKNFRRDPENPDKMERYQAEALIYQTLPVNKLKGILCYDQNTKDKIEQLAQRLETVVPVVVRPQWYL